MNRFRSIFGWRKSHYYDDSDSTGYCSSSDVSKTLSDSQFILRPNTALLSYSSSNCSSFYPTTSSHSSKFNDVSATITSRSSTISTATFESRMTSIEGDDEDEADDDEDDEDASTIRANSVRHIPMMPKLTSIQHLMKQDGNEDEADADADADNDDDDDLTIDIKTTNQREFKNSSFRSFPFSYRLVEDEMDRLFGMLQVDDQIASTSNSTISSKRPKRLLITEPTTKIYYHEQSISEAAARPALSRTESVPRSILKPPNTSSFAIYEEIYGDHLTPPPIDIRPKLPDRPIMAFQSFPPFTAFQPRQRISIRRKKKLPSLHHSTSFASYFRRKK